MNALPLFDYAHARRNDPATSKKAANEFRAGTLPAQIMALLRELGPLTEFEVAARIRRDRVSVSPRFAQLRDQGLIRVNGTKINPATNKEAQIWEIIP